MKFAPVYNANPAGSSALWAPLDTPVNSKARHDRRRGLTSGSGIIVHSVNSLRDRESDLISLVSTAQDAFFTTGTHLRRESRRTTDIVAKAKPTADLISGAELEECTLAEKGWSVPDFWKTATPCAKNEEYMNLPLASARRRSASSQPGTVILGETWTFFRRTA